MTAKRAFVWYTFSMVSSHQLALDQLEGVTVALLDLSESLGRPFTAHERHSFRWLLTRWESKIIRAALLAKSEYYANLIEQARKLLRPVSSRLLDQEEGKTVSLINFAKALGRPLLASERRAFRFVLMGWESAPIKASLRSLRKDELNYYSSLMAQLRELIAPDPVKQLRLTRAKPEAVAQLHGGNFAVKTPPFKGVSIRRLNAHEAKERVELMAKSGEGIAAIARELSLVCNRDRPEAARMMRLGRLMTKLARKFVERAPVPIPAERSVEEIMAEMETLSRLMEIPA